MPHLILPVAQDIDQHTHCIDGCPHGSHTLSTTLPSTNNNILDDSARCLPCARLTLPVLPSPADSTTVGAVGYLSNAVPQCVDVLSHWHMVLA
jgi:hypothetical protein